MANTVAQIDTIHFLCSHWEPNHKIWSFCNERHCKLLDGPTAASPPDTRRPINQIGAGKSFLAEVRKNDPTRKCSANMVEFGKGTLSQVIDVQGFSHGGGHQAVQYRKAGFEKVRCFAYFPCGVSAADDSLCAACSQFRVLLLSHCSRLWCW